MPCRWRRSRQERPETDENVWTRRLVIFLRVMAVLSVAKGLYHWAQVTGFVGGEDEAFENQAMAWQTATVYFAVIELVAAVGLWLATPWGAVVWLTTVVSMAVIELMFPAIYGGSLAIVGVEALLLTGLSGAGLDGRARTAAIAQIGRGLAEGRAHQGRDLLNQLYSGGTGGSLIVSAMARFGDAPAIADGNIRWSYREFGDAVGTLHQPVPLGRPRARAARCRSCRATAPNPGRRFRRRW